VGVRFAFGSSYAHKVFDEMPQEHETNMI